MNWRTVCEFWVSGDPKPQPRPRAFARAGHARVYDPASAEGWKGAVALAAREHRPSEPLQGPLRVSIEFVFRRPKAHYRGTALRDCAPVYHTARPDRDNLDKAVLDALTGIGLWIDDSQVCAGFVSKIYGTSSGAMITVEALDHSAQTRTIDGDGRRESEEACRAEA